MDPQIDVISPEGEIGSIPQSQLNEALNNGFKQASMQELAAYDKSQKYGTPGQQVITGLEGAAEAATFGASTGAERALGVNPQDIMARQQENPLAHATGQMAGLIGGSVLMPEVGAAKLMGSAGEAAVGALGLAGREGALAKIGSSAVKNAIETGILSGGDEVSKMLASDPGQSVETALANVGLSGLIGGTIGGAIGSVSPIWEATAGPKVKSLLEAVKNRSGGIEGLTSPTEEALKVLGKQPDDIIRGVLTPESFSKETAQELLEGDSILGRKAREKVVGFKNELSNDVAETLGKSIADIDENASEYTAGKEIGEMIANNFDNRIKPLASEYEATAEAHSGVKLPKDGTVIDNPMALQTDAQGIPLVSGQTQMVKIPGTASILQDKLGKLASDEAWHNVDDINNLVQKVMKDIPRQGTAKDLYKMAQKIGENTYDPLSSPLSRAGQMIKNLIKDEADDIVRVSIRDSAPEMLSRYDAAREGWKTQSKLKDDIDAILKVKGSTSSYAKNLRIAANDNAEMFIRKLGKGNDAYLINTLKSEMPDVFEKVMDFKKNELLANALEIKQGGEKIISLKKLAKGIEKLSPEMQSSLFTSEQISKLKAIETLDRAIAERLGPSGTARTQEGLTKWMPNAAMGILSTITGHGPLTTAMASILGGGISRETRDAVKYGLLKYLGSGQDISASGFKSMVQYIENVVRAESKLKTGIKSIFRAGEAVLPSALHPTQVDRDKLEKRLEALKKNPEELLNVGGKTVMYMNDHAGPMGMVAANAINYLDSLKPKSEKESPLDDEPTVNKIQKEAYNNALDIAEQPMILLDRVKDGSITEHDIEALHAMYPSLYGKMRQMVTDQMIGAISDKEEIPYDTKLGLSLFLGQPLDSTMTPGGIQSSQMTFIPPAPAPPGPQIKTSFNKLQNLETINMTPQQSAEARKLKG